jgi:hypothetical protein
MNRQRLESLVLVLALASPSLGGQDVSVLPTAEDSRNNSPALHCESGGTKWLAWATFRNRRFRMAIRSRLSGGWSEETYPDSSDTDQIAPFWITGDSVPPSLLYSAFDGKSWTIRMTCKNGQNWSEPAVLAPGTHPSGCMVDRRLWMAWESEGAIHYTKGRGTSFEGPSRSIQPDSQGGYLMSPVLCPGPRGEVWLAWSTARLGYQGVRLRRIDEAGHPVQTVDDGSGINRHPQTSVDADGRLWIVFESMRAIPRAERAATAEAGYPIYVYDRTYMVNFPSATVRVTDGEHWWVPEQPRDPAPGLMPSVLCSSKGAVWLLSRSFTGYTGPRIYFSPLCESLSAGGWANHGTLWTTGQCYKSNLSLAEDPDGRVWAAWSLHDREKRGMLETPSWTHMDGPDRIFVAEMPEISNENPPRLIPLAKPTPTTPDPAPFPRFTSEYQGKKMNVYFGDLHQHSEISGCGRRNGSIDQSQRYTRFVRGLDFMSTIDHAEHQNDHTWRITQLAAEKNNSPGEFVVFTGFEWTSEFDAGGNLYRGHYNAVFRDVGGGDYYFSASDPATNTPLELWNALKAAVGGPQNVLTFAHHTSRRMAWLTWNYYDPEMAPLIEIAQARGSYEYEGCFPGPELDNDCTRVRGHYIRDALERGMRFGFVASGDHGGRQLAAVYAPELTRDSIFESLRAKRVYATNGERMYLDARINGHFMGEEFEIDGEGRKIEIRGVGTAPIVEVDLFRNGRSIRKWAMHNFRVELEWTDEEPLFQRENYYYVRLVQENGGQAWSSPVWVIDREFPGHFRFQVGGDELRVIYPDAETDFAILMHNETTDPVSGRVWLDTPEGWTLGGENGIPVRCEPEEWNTVVFQVTAPGAVLNEIGLPKVTARFQGDQGTRWESPLFVVGSPRMLTREQKAVLIDARTEVPLPQFGDYLKRIARQWETK